MTTQILHKQVSFRDLANVFGKLAQHADTTLDLALEVSDNAVRVIQSNLHGFEAMILQQFSGGTPAAANGNVAGNGEDFDWLPIPNPGGRLGDKYAGLACTHKGHALEVKKIGPARYEARIDGAPIFQGKFKKGVRERIQREAAKL